MYVCVHACLFECGYSDTAYHYRENIVFCLTLLSTGWVYKLWIFVCCSMKMIGWLEATLALTSLVYVNGMSADNCTLENVDMALRFYVCFLLHASMLTNIFVLVVRNACSLVSSYESSCLSQVQALGTLFGLVEIGSWLMINICELLTVTDTHTHTHTHTHTYIFVLVHSDTQRICFAVHIVVWTVILIVNIVCHIL